MDKEDNQNSIWDKIKSLWNSLPELIKLIGTILSIVIALKALLPAAVLEISNFDASPEIIEPGGSSVLNWDVSGSDNITIEPGIGAVSSNGSLSVSPSENTTYKLIATGKGDKKVALCAVTVNEGSQGPLLISSFDANPDSITPGESAVLNWHVAGVPNVTIEPDIGVAEPTGTLNVSPASTTTYKLTASNGDKEDKAYCTVTVEGNAASAENVSSSSLQSGEEKPASQENTVPQENTASFQENTTSKENTASPENTTSKENTASKENLPSIGSFNSNPDTIGEGDSSNLMWSVSAASKVSIEPGIGTVGLTGNQRIFPSKTTTYTLTATNEFGIVTATKVILVQKSSASTSQESASTSSRSPTSTQGKLSPANETELNNSSSETESPQNET
jgi:hypothetical protein